MSRRTNKSALRQAKQGREPGSFFALPKCVLESDEFATLSPFAVKLMMDMAAQHHMGRNGYLSASWTLMQKRGWRSKDTLAKALNELETEGWVVRTRQGGRRICNLFGFSFFRIDDHVPGKPLDIKPTVGPLGYWRKQAALIPDKKSRAPPHVAND
ncbi:hypothetical protein [Aquitalea aquatilis]|uniref:hypothetical protein n=1 Tax=Aquitalea aquatilis TaxID=1537400 RepID=UPI0010BD9583|nr:hypothetical protein [Aquitalea aquatilis]